jgi:hypothetical protein
MKYDEETIEKLYQKNLNITHKRLASVPIAEGREPNIKGLNGWVYEQTIRYCILQELESIGLTPIVNEQVTLFGRVKIDLVISKVAIEIKALGSFGNDVEKYKKYRVKVEERGWEYFYLTRSETYKPYRLETVSTFGEERAFFLDKKGDWGRFVSEVKRRL